MQDIHNTIEKISPCDVTILISGESGTGKDLIARAVHYMGPRSGYPFIPVNCSAIPESLFENELFGHVKGAFTGARYQQSGLVKEAEGGTLFLDEIDAVSPYVQVKLLRLLQDKEYRLLGESIYHKANIRIMVATNRNLKRLMREGSFRDDLYYRLNIVRLYVRPLRERKEDIPLLVKHFIRKYCEEYDKGNKKISENAMNELIAYPWPGNIRELENIVQQAIIMSSVSVIDTADINLPTVSDVSSGECEKFSDAKKRTIESFERNYLITLLQKHRGNVVNAAMIAGKSRTGLWNLIKKYNLSPKQFH